MNRLQRNYPLHFCFWAVHFANALLDLRTETSDNGYKYHNAENLRIFRCRNGHTISKKETMYESDCGDDQNPARQWVFKE